MARETGWYDPKCFVDLPTPSSRFPEDHDESVEPEDVVGLVVAGLARNG